MNKLSSDKRISDLYKKVKKNNELEIAVGEERLRIDLREDNIKLWQETLENFSSKVNLLLACEKADLSLDDNRLTWVVGAAINSAFAENAKNAKKILCELNVSESLALSAVKNCPGVGQDIIWALYLDRHGYLTATPVMVGSKKLSS